MKHLRSRGFEPCARIAVTFPRIDGRDDDDAPALIREVSDNAAEETLRSPDDEERERQEHTGFPAACTRLRGCSLRWTRAAASRDRSMASGPNPVHQSLLN